MTLNALTVDLEEHFQVSNFDHVIDRQSWDAQPSRVEDSAGRLLDLFARHEARATFFVLGWVAERHPALIRRIRDAGHEIACHGFGHQLVYELGPERFREDLSRARRTIEDACGVAVRGYRAPSYSVTERSLWALDILVEQGFEYDSSIFPVRHHRYGIPEFPRHPRRLVLSSGASIDEFPLTTVRLGGVNLPMAGGAYLRFMPAALFRWGFGHVVNQGEPAVLYLHPWEIDAEQPRLETSLKIRINHYFNLARTLPRLARLIDAHPFAPIVEVLDRLRASDRLPEHRLATPQPLSSNEELAASA